MPTNFLWYSGTSNNGLLVSAVNLQTTEMNSLTNASVIVSSVGGTSGVFTNSNTAQAELADLFLKLGAIGSALALGANLTGWFLTSPDGTNYESTTVAPPRPPDFLIPLPATTITAGTYFKSAGLVLIPALKFQVLVQNNSGQTFASSANVLSMAPVAMQY